MVLVDTSVWINHLRNKDTELTLLLNEGKAVIHEFVIGELACGSFKNHSEIINLLMNLNRVAKVTFNGFLFFIEDNKLHGSGIGFVDVHLLASSKLNDFPLFTYDKKLMKAAKQLELSYK